MQLNQRNCGLVFSNFQFLYFRSVDYKDSFFIVLAVAAVFGLVYLVLFFAVRKESLYDG